MSIEKAKQNQIKAFRRKLKLKKLYIYSVSIILLGTIVFLFFVSNLTHPNTIVALLMFLLGTGLYFITKIRILTAFLKIIELIIDKGFNFDELDLNEKQKKVVNLLVNKEKKCFLAGSFLTLSLFLLGAGFLNCCLPSSGYQFFIQTGLFLFIISIGELWDVDRIWEVANLINSQID